MTAQNPTQSHKIHRPIHI